MSLVSTRTEVRVAGGGVLFSPACCQQLSWSVGDCTFQTDFRVLPLSSYDIIVGMDWLELLSPLSH